MAVIEALRAVVERLVRVMGVSAETTRLEGLTSATTTMLSKMISRYDVTKVRRDGGAPVRSLRSLTPFFPAQSAALATQRALEEHAPDAAAFTSRYAALLASRVRELDRFLMFAARVAGDPSLSALLCEETAVVEEGEEGFAALDAASEGRPSPDPPLPPAAPSPPPHLVVPRPAGLLPFASPSPGPPTRGALLGAEAAGLAATRRTQLLTRAAGPSSPEGPRRARDSDSDSDSSDASPLGGSFSASHSSLSWMSERPGGPPSRTASVPTPASKLAGASVEEIDVAAVATPPTGRDPHSPHTTPTQQQTPQPPHSPFSPFGGGGVSPTSPSTPAPESGDDLWSPSAAFGRAAGPSFEYRPPQPPAHAGHEPWGSRRGAAAHGDGGAGAEGGAAAAGARPPATAPFPPLSSLPAAAQEQLLLDDVIYAMAGCTGRYVGVDARGCLAVAPGCDPPLGELASRLLRLCDDAGAAGEFAASRGAWGAHGRVAAAAAGGVRALLRDWAALSAQLEHALRCGRLSMQAAWFYAQPAAGCLRQLALFAATATAGSLRGAHLLNALQRQAAQHSGDAAAVALLSGLLRVSAAPYVAAIGDWVYTGTRVDDPFDELLIVEAPHCAKESLALEYNSTFWAERFTLRPETPLFLDAATARRYGRGEDSGAVCMQSLTPVTRPSLFTKGAHHGQVFERHSGVRLPRGVPLRRVGAHRVRPRQHAVRWKEGGGVVRPPSFFPSLIPISSCVFAHSHVERIDAAFSFASKELLSRLFKDHGLMGRLRLLKHYFLLDQGDFLVHFLDAAGEELLKLAPDVSPAKLQVGLEVALRASAAASEPGADALGCRLEKHALINMLLSIFATSEEGGADAGAGGGADEVSEHALTGFDTFTLDCRVAWPLSLVISCKELTKYQLIFRHLFHCRFVERQLAATWQLHQSTRCIAGPGGKLGRAYCLCSRMLHFMQNFMYYVSVEVIEPNWAILEASLAAAPTVDAVMEAHDKFLDSIMKEGMMFWPKILKRLERIKAICLRFAATTAALEEDAPPLGAAPPTPPVTPRRSTAASPVGGQPFGMGAAAAAGLGRKSSAQRAAQVASLSAAASEPGFAAALRALEAQFDTQLRELTTALTASQHLEPNLASLCARLDFSS